ncbi:hypothetical protein INT45_000418 [Circinella minor]|uniref:Uncharacterized protein n=1 Tax=Circinella minor TaxID=1195481 RepID=A0A8H7RU11_9FUNG|nr:hypothetical protein INT45_000418 [Circinella minor]
MSQDNVGQLLTSFVQATTESTSVIKGGFKKVMDGLKVLNENQAEFESELSSQLNHILLALERQGKDIESVKEQLEKGAITSRFEYPQIEEEENPFAGERIKRNVQPPKPEGKSLQFKWDYFEALGKSVLAKKKKPWLHQYYTTFKRNVLRFSDELAYDIKKQHQLNSDVTYSDLDKQIRLEAEKRLEELVAVNKASLRVDENSADVESSEGDQIENLSNDDISDVVHSNTDAGNEEQETNNNKLMNLETELSEMEEEASDNDDDRFLTSTCDHLLSIMSKTDESLQNLSTIIRGNDQENGTSKPNNRKRPRLENDEGSSSMGSSSSNKNNNLPVKRKVGRPKKIGGKGKSVATTPSVKTDRRSSRKQQD